MLLSLPDETLLAVLAHLAPRELFNCRVVCRRLRDLSLHRSLWQAAVVKDKGLLRAALNLAPCLGKISPRLPLETIASFMPSTTCAVANLGITVHNESDAAQATIILLKLSALSGVRSLNLENRCPPGQSLSTLLNATHNVIGLRKLSIQNYSQESLSVAWCDLKTRPSLTKLLYSSNLSEPFLHLLLETHAATLQEMCLFCRNDQVGTLLAQIPNLRSLTCFPSNDLSHLAVLPDLQSIHVMSLSEAYPPGALEFLRGASNLRSVKITNNFSSEPALALAESPSASQIESLTITTILSETLALVVPVLCKFSSLTSLSMNSIEFDCVNFLRAMCWTSLPCLTTLKIPFPREICLHSWLHGPAVQGTLIRNPRLHIRDRTASTTAEDCSCQWCQWGCHELLRESDKPKAYASHSRGPECPADCYRVVLPTGPPSVAN
ncbi:uncharacterized protein LOC117647171 isoform X2 [Thrips palmi]|nr:uncharacterized protein LOC117647171 isoform X2 [Thrips palmi]XP_034244643.1 uncharacterized protein LOC117647171 isoform X2 [Thrips palmi]XP_034244644.1 uncharacterized protein LOC117647171 isoform X2 [Thrips palmi]XP_034244645.1 uncharacterized protein LOC117647171 isoform X2 [Thrips palmi]XP_034244646.1 uncharacterized protein LOC117647171 isoform X2 [Thrips palmi]XP_034244647.1 uncharacterized protein LOC117647171 isoform X2 [Thrips palmi]XP_034244649.1 uncharacterized protein LOC11764